MSADDITEPTDALEEALVAYDVECQGNLFGTSGAGAYALAQHLHAAGFRGPDPERDGRLLQVFLSGYAAGTAGETHRGGAPVDYAQGYGRHLAEHIVADPVACAQILEGLVPLFETGVVPPDAQGYITVHNGHESDGG